jgi:hypothetical protein
VSIIRIGLAETKNFAEGFDAIFGKKKETPAKEEKTAAKSDTGKKKKKGKKKGK